MICGASKVSEVYNYCFVCLCAIMVMVCRFFMFVCMFRMEKYHGTINRLSEGFEGGGCGE